MPWEDDVTAHLTASPHEDTTQLAEIRQHLMGLVEQRMRGFLAAQRLRWSGIDPRATVPIDAVAELVDAGGKRIRPAFCLTGYLAAGGDPTDESVVPVAVALELLHASALIHDDVMDASSHRRGVPTVHTKHSGEHDRHRWQGESRRFGESVAILAGDLALIYSDQFIAGASPAVGGVWADLRAELVIGQYMDVAAAAECSIDPELSRWVALVKAGRYTIHRPLMVGAMMAGRPELEPAFEAYGAAIGEAFQLRDDLLDAFGDTAETGKPCGLDLEQQKMTLLVALATKRDPRVRELLTNASSSASRLRELLVESEVRGEVEAHIAGLVEQGCQAVSHAPILPAWQDELVAMAHRAAYRNA